MSSYLYKKSIKQIQIENLLNNFFIIYGYNIYKY